MDCRPIGDWPQTGPFKFRFFFVYPSIVHRRKARRHELTHSNGKRGTADNSQSLGLVQPSVDRPLWLLRNA